MISDNSLPPSGGGDQGAYMLVSAEGMQDLLQSSEEFTQVFYPLFRWFAGMDYERPKGLAATVFDLLARRQVRNLEDWRRKSTAGKKCSVAKAEAVRANGLKGGRPRKSGNLTETKQKPNGNQTETKDLNPNLNPNLNINNVVVESASSATNHKRVFPTLDEVLHKAYELGIPTDFAESFFRDMSRDEWVIIKDGKTVEVNKLNLSKMLHGRWRHHQPTQCADANTIEALAAEAARIDAERGE